MRVYFAHPVSDFGSEWKRGALAYLREAWDVGVEIVDPESPEHEAAYRERGMAHFEELVRTCDALVFAPFPGGSIGAGVGKEIDAAESAGLPVWQMSRLTTALYRVYPTEDSLRWQYLTVERTRERLRELKVAA